MRAPNYRPCPDPAAALRALLRTQATAGPLSPLWHVPSDYADDDLRRIDAAAQLAVAAREIHPPAVARISAVRHAIAGTMRARAASRQAQAQAAPQPAQATHAPGPSGDGGRPVARPTPPQVDPQGPHSSGRHPDDAQERHDRPRLTERQLAEMF